MTKTDKILFTLISVLIFGSLLACTDIFAEGRIKSQTRVATISDPNTLGWLTVRGWNFTIPHNAEVNGIKVTIPESGTLAHLRMGIGDSSTSIGEVREGDSPYGGQGDLWGAEGYLNTTLVNSDYLTFSILPNPAPSPGPIEMTVYYK